MDRKLDQPKHRLAQAIKESGYDRPTDAWTANKRALTGIGKDLLISNANGNRAISKRAAALYAKVFGHSPAWYLYSEAEPVAVPTAAANDDRRIPIVSMVAAGRLREQAGVLPADVSRYLRLSELPKGDWLGLIVEGESMNRIAPDGAVILVNRAESTLVDGRYYVFSVGGGDATFKRFRRSPARMQPYSTDPDFTSTPVDDVEDLYVFGRVRKIIQDV